jgi:hypothetical protein
MASARERPARAAAELPSGQQMKDAASKHSDWDQNAYEKLKKTGPSNQKDSKKFAEFLVLKALRPKAYKKGDDVVV